VRHNVSELSQNIEFSPRYSYNDTSGIRVTIHCFSIFKKENCMADSKKDIVICTIATKNYLASARVLADSFLKYHPNGKMYVLLVDMVDGYFDPEQEKFEVITIDDIKDPSIGKMLFWYRAKQASYSMKPYLLSYLFNKFGYKKLIFFDSDIMITSRLDDIWELLNKNSIIMTPHNTDPISPEWYDIPNETITLMWGVINIGFIALANDLNAQAFLAWWGERCYRKCIFDPEHGITNEMKWLDLAIGYFNNIHILRDPTYNVWWGNIDYLKIDSKAETTTINGEPMHFYHFASFNPDNFSNVGNFKKLTPAILKHLTPLFQAYRDALLANQYKETRKWPYAFNYFDNGRRIPDIARSIYWNLGDKAQLFGNPFITHGSHSYFKWLFRSPGGLFKFCTASLMLFMYRRIFRFSGNAFHRILKLTKIGY
jgi:hypothetical protein